MKNIFLAISFLFLYTSNINAQAPESFSFQAVVRNSSNDLIMNGNIGMRISIVQGAANGTPVYVETHTTSTNVNGLISLVIGTGTIESGVFADIDWSTGVYFVQTETDPNGGSNYSITSTTQLLSVPYALSAKTAERALTSANGFKHCIGEVFEGGVIFHLYKTADGIEHGLIVSLIDLDSATAWSNVTTNSIGVNAQSSWNGLSNAQAITNQNGHIQSAAQICFNYISTDGFDDWYLPSIDELTLLFNNRFDVNRTLSTAGVEIGLLDFNQSFNYLHYWSSTEINDEEAWRFSFTPGANDFSHFAQKSSENNVRAIRAF